MPLTLSFKKTVLDRINQDTEFADALLREGVQMLLDGDVETGKEILRDYINGTIGFEELAVHSKVNAKSLMRMFSKTGNPQARKLFPILAHLQKLSGRHLQVAIG